MSILLARFQPHGTAVHVCYLLVLKAVVSFITTNISSNGYVVMELMMLWTNFRIHENGNSQETYYQGANYCIVKAQKQGSEAAIKFEGICKSRKGFLKN